MKGLDALRRAREALADVTPLLRDCGGLCGGACCQPDCDGRGGMLLFLGEEALYGKMPEGFSVLPDRSLGDTGLILFCGGVCERAERPLACRIFPLAFGEREGRPTVFPDPRAWPLCPLMPSGTEGLSERFVSAAEKVAAILWEDPLQRGFIIRQHAFIKRFSMRIWDDGRPK